LENGKTIKCDRCDGKFTLLMCPHCLELVKTREDGEVQCGGCKKEFFRETCGTCEKSVGKKEPLPLEERGECSSCKRGKSLAANPNGRAGDGEDIKEEVKDKDEEDKDMCKICFASIVDCAYVPCGHVLACYNCSVRIGGRCPVCKNPITQILKLYRS
jgi:hypothetical protein